MRKPALTFPGTERYKMPEIHSPEGNAISHGNHMESPVKFHGSLIKHDSAAWMASESSNNNNV